jgi:uncharacterized membrane protein YfhO
MMIEQFASDLLNRLSTELKKENNIKRIEDEIICPLLSSVSSRIYPWITLLFIMYTLILVLIIILFIIIYKKNQI